MSFVLPWGSGNRHDALPGVDTQVALAQMPDAGCRGQSVAEAATRELVGRTLAEVERALILDTLDHCLGNRTQAARILGISIRTLRNKLNEYAAAGIPIPEPGQVRVTGA